PALILFSRSLFPRLLLFLDPVGFHKRRSASLLFFPFGYLLLKLPFLFPQVRILPAQLGIFCLQLSVFRLQARHFRF
ncbi:MAG: hypothetical protein L0332_23015, partial [Chloroflexi bacterium]|nr:hypothetical protein [Chloroflexota bacterium]MCI0729563.1 hypothetical protein [Chloroflexota bacterium]